MATIPALNTALTKDWLANNALISFMGSLLVMQGWGKSGGGYEYPGGITAPDFTDAVLIGIATGLFILALTLAAASIAARFSNQAFMYTRSLAPIFAVFMWLGYSLGMLSILSDLPANEWWTHALAWGSLLMFFFLAFRIIIAWAADYSPWQGDRDA